MFFMFFVVCAIFLCQHDVYFPVLDGITVFFSLIFLRRIRFFPLFVLSIRLGAPTHRKILFGHNACEVSVGGVVFWLKKLFLFSFTVFLNDERTTLCVFSSVRFWQDFRLFLDYKQFNTVAVPLFKLTLSAITFYSRLTR